MTGQPKSKWDGPGRSPGFLLWRVTLAWQRAMRSALAPHDLTHVQFVLLATLWWLADHEGRPTQQQLAGRAGTDTMMTSQVVRKLEERGLVARDVDPDDSRARRLRLTDAGRDVLTGALADVEAADDAFFAGRDALVRGLVSPESP
ncbi:MarR family winged helix-turn-helix transcriptional regulator [Saccharothrix variisporea]|uniref:MarR family transcriptional regulator n=1 Tax=Saccharothrix variisporea TaxID=543527 RepID=A0A495XD90_9PSEU|nr:MarR family transcriptional regulator [Saccharothrix variisporea]RKT70794.1 MarR family transcriptional regulator [Saccharothrix variisporea]